MFLELPAGLSWNLISSSCVSVDETRDFQQSVQPTYGVERSFPIHDLVATVATRLYTAGSCESNLLSRKVQVYNDPRLWVESII